LGQYGRRGEQEVVAIWKKRKEKGWRKTAKRKTVRKGGGGGEVADSEQGKICLGIVQLGGGQFLRPGEKKKEGSLVEFLGGRGKRKKLGGGVRCPGA